MKSETPHPCSFSALRTPVHNWYHGSHLEEIWWHPRIKPSTAWHQRHLLTRETFSLHIRSRDCTTLFCTFCYKKECFHIKFVSKTKEFTSPNLPGRGEDNIPSSALRKLKLPSCWEVLRSLSLFLMPILKGVKCLHLTLPSVREGAEYHTSKLMQKVYFVSPEPETLQTTNTCSFKLFPL